MIETMGFDTDKFGSGLDTEYNRRKTEEPIRYVKFNPAVRKYADNWCDPEKKIIIFSASNAIGKTYSTVALLGWTIWPELAPDWFKGPIKKKLAEMDHSFRICSTPKEVETTGTIQRAIKSLWPKGRYTTEKNRKAFDCVFQTDNGWVGDIMTYEQEAQEFEGATRGLIIYNEPPPEPIRKACVFRTRMGGFEVFPMTPLADAAWIKDKLVDRWPADKSIEVCMGTMEQACADHSPNGHLKHETIQRLIAEMDPDEVRARAHGEFIHLAGLIYRFNRATYMSKVPLQSQRIGQPFQVVDPGGFNKPFAVIWGQIVANPMQGIQIMREWPPGGDGPECYFENIHRPDMKLEDYAKMFGEVEKKLRFHKEEVHRILDRRFGHVRDSTDGLSMRDHFGEKGYYFYDSYSVPEKTPELSTGIQAVKNYLKVDPVTNVPYLLIDPCCVNTARAFERWGLDPKTQKPRDDVWKNFMDIVRYLCAANLQVVMREPDDSEVHAPYYGVR